MNKRSDVISHTQNSYYVTKTLLFRLQKISLFYGYLPRHKRRQILHEYLWYVVYCLSSSVRAIPTAQPLVSCVSLFP